MQATRGAFAAIRADGLVTQLVASVFACFVLFSAHCFVCFVFSLPWCVCLCLSLRVFFIIVCVCVLCFELIVLRPTVWGSGIWVLLFVCFCGVRCAAFIRKQTGDFGVAAVRRCRFLEIKPVIGCCFCVDFVSLGIVINLYVLLRVVGLMWCESYASYWLRSQLRRCFFAFALSTTAGLLLKDALVQVGLNMHQVPQ